MYSTGMAPASAVAKPDGDDVMIVDKLPAKPDDDDDAMPVDKLPEEINEMKIKDERVEKVVPLHKFKDILWTSL